jgi:hypothetical protein
MESGSRELAEVLFQDASQGLEAITFLQRAGTPDLLTRIVRLLKLESPTLNDTVIKGFDAIDLQSAGNAAIAQMA